MREKRRNLEGLWHHLLEKLVAGPPHLGHSGFFYRSCQSGERRPHYSSCLGALLLSRIDTFIDRFIVRYALNSVVNRCVAYQIDVKIVTFLCHQHLQQAMLRDGIDEIQI